jgi:hypothetical protein
MESFLQKNSEIFSRGVKLLPGEAGGVSGRKGRGER